MCFRIKRILKAVGDNLVFALIKQVKKTFKKLILFML